MDLKDAVTLAMDGREEGYNYLYQQTYQKSYYVALKYMKQEDAALDVLQDAYIKAFHSLDQLQDADKFPAWFAKVVASKALDELKKRKVVLFSQMETEDSTVESMFEDDRIDAQPELSLDQKETSRLVQEMISTLSDEQRICIMMLYVEEMSVKEIAETLGVSENTVKSRLNYGRKNIKEKVEELEKKGTKLYGLAPIPFFLYLLLSDSMNAQAAELPVNHIFENATRDAIKEQQGADALTRQGAGALSQLGGKAMGIMSKKVIIGIVASIVVIGGTTAGVFAYQAHQNQLAEEAAATMQQEEANVQIEKASEPIAEEAAEPTKGSTLDEAAETPEATTGDTTKDTTEESAEPTENIIEGSAETAEKTERIKSTESVPEATTEEEAIEQTAQSLYTFTDLSATKYAKSSVNVRDLPTTDGEKLGGLSTNVEVAVTGQCNETSWYRIDYNGAVGYVSDKYLLDSPVEVTQAPEKASTASSIADKYKTVYMQNEGGIWYASDDGMTCHYYSFEFDSFVEVDTTSYTITGLWTKYPDVGQVYDNGDGTIKMLCCGCCGDTYTAYGIMSYNEACETARNMGYTDAPDTVYVDEWVGTNANTWPHNLCWYIFSK